MCRWALSLSPISKFHFDGLFHTNHDKKSIMNPVISPCVDGISIDEIIFFCVSCRELSYCYAEKKPLANCLGFVHHNVGFCTFSLAPRCSYRLPFISINFASEVVSSNFPFIEPISSTYSVVIAQLFNENHWKPG